MHDQDEDERRQPVSSTEAPWEGKRHVTELVDPSTDTGQGEKTSPRATAAAGINTPTRTPGVACGRCGARWGGWNTTHCAGCHRTFSGMSAFDKHRTGSHVNGDRHCLEPTKAGLALLGGRRYECWGLESDGTDFWNDAA